MLFSNKLDHMLYLMLKKDKKNREKILNVLNKVPNDMYLEIQKILNDNENDKLYGAIREFNTKEYNTYEYIIKARYVLPQHELTIECNNLKIGTNTQIYLSEKEGILSDKGLYIKYEKEDSNFIKYNLSSKKRYIIPIVKSCYSYKKPKELTLSNANKKFNK